MTTARVYHNNSVRGDDAATPWKTFSIINSVENQRFTTLLTTLEVYHRDSGWCTLDRESRAAFCFLAWKKKSPEGFRAVGWWRSSFERSRAPFKSLRFSLFCLSYVLFLVASMILFLRLLMYRSMKTVLLSARSGNQSSLRSCIAYSDRSQNSLMSFVSM